MLPARNYRLIPPDRAVKCDACDAVYLGAGTGSQKFVAFHRADPAPDEPGWVPPTLIETVDEEPGQTLVRHRAFEGRTITVRPARETSCDGCVAQAARLIKLEDGAPLRAVIAEKNRELAESEATITARDARVAELEDAVRGLRRDAVIRGVREKPAKPAKQAA